MDNDLIDGSAELTETKKAHLQQAALIILKEAKLRHKSVKVIVDEFAGHNEVGTNFQHQGDAGFCMATGIAIARRRRQLAMSQSSLGTRAGFQRSYISDLESGRRNLSLRNLVALASALDLSPSALLQNIEEICNV